MSTMKCMLHMKKYVISTSKYVALSLYVVYMNMSTYFVMC